MYKIKKILDFFKGARIKNKRDLLLEKIMAYNFPEKEVFVSVEDFFDGNEDNGSIGANIFPDPPSLKEFYDILKEIEKKPETENIFIRICDINDGEWFYSDTVYISGSYSSAEVKKMFLPLKPDEIYKGLMFDKTSNIPQLNIGIKEYCVWWD